MIRGFLHVPAASNEMSVINRTYISYVYALQENLYVSNSLKKDHVKLVYYMCVCVCVCVRACVCVCDKSNVSMKMISGIQFLKTQSTMLHT